MSANKFRIILTILFLFGVAIFAYAYDSSHTGAQVDNAVSVANTISAYMQTVINDADEATFKATVNLEAGTDVLAPNGDGSNLTNVDAATGDSATSFFDAGTIEHERGGLEANVSAYTGIIGINAGTTAEIDTAAELETYAGLGAFFNEYADDADAATMRTTMGLIIGTNVLAPDGDGGSLTNLDGENLQNDSVDDDALDFSDITCVDLTTSDCGDVTTTGTFYTTVGFDAIGAADIDYGSIDITDHRFITDGTGDGEIVLPNDSIGPAEMAAGAYDLGTSLEADTITEGGTGVYNITESDAAYQPLEAILTDIADGTIATNLVNTANPWADNEVSDTLTVGASGSVNDSAIPAGVTRDSEWDSAAEINAATTDDDFVLLNGALGTPTSGVGTNLTALNGENLQDDTVDDDSIDFVDVTSSDLTFDADSVINTSVYAGTTSLEETTAANDSGASIVGVFDEFDNSNSTNVQDVLDDLDAAIAGGSGDVTGVGDCASGACFDGSSDGGSYVRIYDGDSHYGEVQVPDVSSNVTYTLPAATSTLLATDGVGTSLTALNGENIQDDTIDDDSIDFTDVTSTDITFDADTVATTAVYSGTTSLEETTAANDSGAYIIGVFDEFDNSNAANIQDVLDDLDAAITGSGSGDITAVGDCAVGECLDGSSDGGSYVRIYDGDSHYGELQIPNISANTTYTFPAATSTLLATDGVGTSLTALNGENIQDDTIDDDSIDFTDVTSSDLTFDADSVATTSVYSGTTSLEETTAANDSGAAIIGVFDEFTHSNSANVQDVLDDLDAAIPTVVDQLDDLVDVTGEGSSGYVLQDDADGTYSFANITGYESALEGVIDLQDLQGAATDGQVPNDITIDLATLATTLTITDNESTAETNAVLFTSGGDLDGGNLGIESDGDLTYTPSTGTLDATALTEGGTAVYNTTESDAAYQPLESTLTDIADGTIAENLVNTANPWADDEVANTLTVTAQAGSTWDVADSVTSTSVYSGTTSLEETTAANDSGANIVGVYDEFDNSNSTTVQDVLDDLDAAITGASGTPGGSDTQIQYNNGGSFGGISAFIWDDTNIEVADNTALAFGTEADFLFQYDETTDDRLEITATNAAADESIRLENPDGTYEMNLSIEGDVTSGGTIEGATLTEGGVGVYNTTESDAAYQPLESTLTDIADGTIAENLVNTANPWADNEVADDITASNYLPLTGGTLTGELVADELGIEFQETDSISDCSGFAATGGGIFYDDSDGKLKKCQDNVLTDLDTTGGGGDSVSIDGVGVTDPDFVSSGDIDFVDTSNTVTANLNTDSVDDTHVNWASMTYLGEEGQTTAAGVGLASDNLDDTDASIEWEDATDLDADGSVSANAVTLATDTAGNFVATVADAGSSTVTVSGSGSENAAVTLDVADNGLTNAHFTHSTDWGDIETDGSGNVLIDAGVIVDADINAAAAIAISKTALVAGTNITLSTNTLNVDDAFITNDAADLLSASTDGTTELIIRNTDGSLAAETYLLELQHTADGSSNGDFIKFTDAYGGTPATLFNVEFDGDTTMAGDLTISGDDLFLATNTDGMIMVADGTNFNPVQVSGDVEIDNTGATSIQTDSVDAAHINWGDITYLGEAGQPTAAAVGLASGNLDDTDASIEWEDAGDLEADGTISANAVALSTDTTGNFVATVADGGSGAIDVSGSGSENAAVTLALDLAPSAGSATLIEEEDALQVKYLSTDFDEGASGLAIDYTNGQAAATGVKGFLTGSDWDTFNGKEGDLANEAGLYAALSDVSQFYEPGDTLQTGSGTSLPGSCTTGELYIDTDADTDGSLYHCVSTDTWKEVDDDGAGGGSGTMTTVEDGDSQVGGADIVTLDFDGTVFAITESPDTEINIDVADDGLDSQHYAANSVDSEHISTIVESVFWDAAGMIPDGTQCDVASDPVTINSGPMQYTAICADNDSSTLYGHIVMPDSWDAGTVTFELEYLQTAADTSALNSDIAAMCRGATETVNNTWGSEVAIDDAAVTGSNAVDHTTSAAVTANGTCAGGDTLYFRWQLDATGTTTAVATLHILGMKMEYTSNIGD